MSTLAFDRPIYGRARLHHPHRSDIWSYALTGIKVPRLNVVTAKDLSRRGRCERNFMEFKLTYFPHLFWDPCSYHVETTARKQAVTLLKDNVVYQEAEAAPRSIGKSTDCVAWACWNVCYGHIDYTLFLPANNDKAQERVKAVKHEFLNNALLRDDFPDLCGWVQSFGGDPRRCKILYPGREWNDNELYFPNGCWVAACGMDASLPGMNKNGKRPGLVIFEDVEDLKVASSLAMMEGLDERIRLEALKLHDINKKAIYWFVCTIYAKGCVADKITDPAVSPQWRGRRYRALQSWPDRRDMWDAFVELYRGQASEKDYPALAAVADVCSALCVGIEGFEMLIPGHQLALRWYVANREAMDAGAMLLDPIRLPLHRCFEEIAKDERGFMFQYQNDPPDDENKKTLQLDVEYLMSRRTGLPRTVVPAWARFVTFSVDVGARELHWEADAWDSELRTSCLVDQGVQATDLNAGGEYIMADDSRERAVMVADAVQRALQAVAQRAGEGFVLEGSGHPVMPSIFGVDCGGAAGSFAWYETVIRFCHKLPRWIPLKGSAWHRSIADRALGRNWIVEAQNNPGRRHDCNADEYKMQVANAYNAPLRTKDGDVFPGARILHADAPRIYATHQTAEYWSEVFAEKDAPVGKEVKMGWNLKPSARNHWWDTAWMAYALADIFRHNKNIRTTQRSRPREFRRPETPGNFALG